MSEKENEELDSYRETPLYQKALEIMKLTHKLVESVKKTDIDFTYDAGSEVIEQNLGDMRANALLIPAKIAGAWNVGLYALKMENAAIIRKAAQDIILELRGIQTFGYKDIEYLDLIRNEIEEFRVLFAEWVKTFDPWDYIIDRWGLFNPPGVNYDDHDPDDDLPFDPGIFFDDKD